MLDADVDSLFDIAVADSLVDDYAHRSLGHIVDDTSLAMINLVGHSLYQLHAIPNKRVSVKHSLPKTHPFCTAPLALMSTMSPTLQSS